MSEERLRSGGILVTWVIPTGVGKDETRGQWFHSFSNLTVDKNTIYGTVGLPDTSINDVESQNIG